MIRRGRMEDRPHFLRLWARFLEEQRKLGSHVLPNLRNLYHCLEAFESYTAGNVPGGVVFWWPKDLDGPVAGVMGGANLGPNDWDTDLGQLATLWGVYVDPEYQGQGIGLKIFGEIAKIGVEMGFDSVETFVIEGNGPGAEIAVASGAKPHTQQYFMALRDPETMNSEAARHGLAREVK